MRKNNPFISLLDQIVEIMNRIQSHKGGVKQIPKELIDELKRLESEYAAIKEQESTKLILEAGKKDFNTLRIEAMRSSGTEEYEKKSLERAVKAGRDAELLKAEIEKLKSKFSSAETKKTQVDKSQIRNARERRKRFKSIGENKKWIPL